MRRELWNIYAWPVTLLIAVSSFHTVERLGLVAAVDVVFSIPSLVALHLHIREKIVLSGTFWKSYAFGFIVWQLDYGFLLEPIVSGQRFKPTALISLIILLPLFVAIFRYAFREWGRAESPGQGFLRTG